LQANLAAAQAELMAQQTGANPDAVLINASQTKIAKIQEAIQGWQSIITYIDTTLQKAEAGNLSSLTNLMPHELMAAARTLDQQLAPEAAAKLELYDAISFTGGGNAVCLVGVPLMSGMTTLP
jgi:hypothetical protein